MSNKQANHLEFPPRLPGSYILRDADEDIIYWGDTTDLYETWCTKEDILSIADCHSFEYVLKDI